MSRLKAGDKITFTNEYGQTATCVLNADEVTGTGTAVCGNHCTQIHVRDHKLWKKLPDKK